MADNYFNSVLPPVVKTDRSIFINQAGYKPSDRKIAVLVKPAENAVVKNESGETVMKVSVTHFGIDNLSGDDVYRADFSSLKDCGRYYIEADNGERSYSFSVAENVYDDCFEKVMRAFYYLRCGMELKEPYSGRFSHSACHTGTALLWEDNSKTLFVNGGWHDAGDYGRYVTAACCAVQHILISYRFFPEVFKSKKLNIPESDGVMPDILWECKYELDWLLKMQNSEGGVYHKVTTRHHAPFIMPEDDKEQLYVFPVSSMATADFVAVCALASVVYRQFDKEYAEKLLTKAKLSWNWLCDNKEFIGFTNPEDVNTGGYGERDDKDNRFWAACELYGATGEAEYHDALKNILSENSFSLHDLGYGSVGGFGSVAYLLSENTDEELTERIKQDFIGTAFWLKENSDSCGYMTSMNEPQYCWGSNMNLLKNGMILAIADILEGKHRFKEYASAQLNTLLGVNANGYSYVSGVGEFCINNPHLRPSFADGIDECIPGMISGGPNRFPGDHDAKIYIKEGTPPMKCFVDSVSCYSLNEITIYWNSPAVFLLAFLDNDGK